MTTAMFTGLAVTTESCALDDAGAIPSSFTRITCIISPPKDDARGDSLDALAQLDIDALLARHGTVLLRGFAMAGANAFAGIAGALCTDLYEDNYEHPAIKGQRAVYRTTPYPADLPILAHNENSHLDRWPRKILFGCLQPPASGGATTLYDASALLDRVPARIVDAFARRGICYQRIFGGGLGIDWRVAFRTTDRDAVDAECAAQSIDHAWLDGERLRLRWSRSGVLHDLRSGKVLWFNQLLHFHPALLTGKMGQRLRQFLAPMDMPRNCTFGDGHPIADEDALAVLQASRDIEFGHRWAQGDVLAIDNVRMAHGREPYLGERALLVAMGEVGRASSQ